MFNVAEKMASRDVLADHYDQAKFKLHASIRWLCSFIPSYHQDKVKNNVRENLSFLALPPRALASSGVWRDIIALLVSCEAYRCASLAIFGHPAPINHWQVIQTLARHGFYVVTEDGTGVVQTALLTASPFNQESHIAMIDCLMQAYACHLVTIPRVVAVVKKIGSFNASQELPYDLEDSLVLWINKVCSKVRNTLKEAVSSKQENLKLGLVHPSTTPLPPTIPYLEDLVHDIGDGQCLGVLLHSYLPNDLPLDVLKFGRALPQADKAANLGAVRFILSTVLGVSWFPISIEMFLNPSFCTKPNIVVFVSELFWKFEVKGVSRNQFSSDRWLKEEERTGVRDMNCAAAATEISLHLEKCPVQLEEAPAAASSDSEPEPETVVPTPFRSLQLPPALPGLVPEVIPRLLQNLETTDGSPKEENAENKAVKTDAKDVGTTKYFEKCDSSIHSTIQTTSIRSQSLGSLAKVSDVVTPDGVTDSNPDVISGGGGGRRSVNGPTALSLQILNRQTENDSESSNEEQNKENISRLTMEEKKVSPEKKKIQEKTAEVVSNSVNKTTPPKPIVELMGYSSPKHERRKSGEEIVDEMRLVEEEKREFYLNIAKWVDSVEKECKPPAIPVSELTTTISKTIETHFSKRPAAVGLSFTISSEDKEEARRRGLPIIPITPEPAPPEKIKEDYLMTVQERDDALRKQKEEEERKKREELDLKRQMEEKAAEEKRLLEEMSDTSNKSTGSKKGKKGAKGAGGKKGAKQKEGKTFPRRPNSGGSTSSVGSNKSATKGPAAKGAAAKGPAAKGAAKGKKGRAKDDMSVKSDKVARSKSVKADPAGKRRVKSARRAGKSVSFIDEKSETGAELDAPVMDLVPKEDPLPKPECPHKKDTQVIGENRTALQKMSYFVSLEDTGLGLGSGPILDKQAVSRCPGWQDDGSTQDSLLVMRHTDSDGISEDSSSEEESNEDSESSEDEEEVNKQPARSDKSVDFAHILNSLQPQFGSEPVFVFERRENKRGSRVQTPTDPKQLLLHLQMQEKRRNIEKYRNELQNKWEEERAALNRHVFYEAIKKTRDIGEQANSEDIRAEIERSDSLEDLMPHVGRVSTEPFNPKQENKSATPTNIRPQTLLEQAITETEIIFSPVAVECEDENNEVPGTEHSADETNTFEKTDTVKTESFSNKTPDPKRTEESSETELIAVFSDHDEFLSTKISSVCSTPSSSRKPTTMQYFYGFTDVVTDNKISEKRQQFFVAQKKKQEELKARRELELQRKLESARLQSHIDGRLRREEGNLVTKCRAKSSRVRVVRSEADHLTPARPASAVPHRTPLMTCRTPDSRSYPTTPDSNNHMYPDRSKSLIRNGSAPCNNGGSTYRKHSHERPPQQDKPPSRHHKNSCHLSETKNLKNSPKSSPCRPPTLPLFVPPSGKTNSKVISNAVCWTCLSGVPDRQQQQMAIKAIADNRAQQYVILFRDGIARKFRGIYTFHNESSKLIKIFGKGPRTILQPMISNLFKYDSGSRAFSLIATTSFSPTVDGITIRNELWRRAGVLPC